MTSDATPGPESSRGGRALTGAHPPCAPKAKTQGGPSRKEHHETD